MEKKSKMVKMESKPKKLTYEELEKVAKNFHDEYQKVFMQLREAQSVIAEFNEIGMLLSIIEKEKSFEAPFISRCVKKVQEIVSKALDAAEEAEKKENA